MAADNTAEKENFKCSDKEKKRSIDEH